MIVDSLTETQCAYIAGMIDGEGSLEVQKQTQKGAATPAYRARLSFGLATKEPLETMGSWLGLHPKEYESKCPLRSNIFRMHIPKRISIALVKRMLPYLILKRRQAELFLEIDDVRAKHSPSRSLPMGEMRRMPLEALNKMESLYVEFRSLKSNKRPGNRKK